MSGPPADDSSQSTDPKTDGDGLFSIDRRNVMKAAGASAGAIVGGGTLLGSATAETADGNCVQVDFVTGTSEISDLSSSTYSGGGRLIQAKWGETVDNDTENANETVDRTTKNATCDVNTSSDLSIDFGTETASVEYTVSNCSGSDQELLLVSYESPCNGAAGSGGEWDPTNAGQQTVFDTATTSTQSGGSLTVDVPPLAAGVPRRSSAEAYYPLDNDAGTNCITGNPITKVDGNNSIDTSADGAVANTNGAFDLKNVDDGDDDALVSDSSLPINGDTATVAGWFNFDSRDSYGRVIQVGGSLSGTPGDGYDIEFNPNNDEIHLLTFSGYVQTGTIPVSSSKWYFFVTVLDKPNNDTRLHVFDTNGELSESPVTGADGRSRDSTDKELYIGGGGNNYVDGRFDDVYAFSTALTRSDVISLYNATTTSTPKPVRNTTQAVDYATVQGAIDDANSGDTIQLDPGTYEENIVVDVPNLTLESSGDYTDTALQTGGGADEMVLIDADGVTVSGLTIRSTASTGQPLHLVTTLSSSTSPVIEDCLFDGNDESGGEDETATGVLVGTDTTIRHCTFQGTNRPTRLGIDDGSSVTDSPAGTTMSKIEFVDSRNSAVEGKSKPSGLAIDVSSISVNQCNFRGGLSYGAFAKDTGNDNDLDLTNNYWEIDRTALTNGNVDVSSPAMDAFSDAGPRT
jgi:hypothetical protein